MSGLKKIIVISCIIVAIIGVAFVGVYELAGSLAYENSRRLYEEESYPLSLLRADKLAEYGRVEEQMLADAGCKSELVFVSKGADAQLYTDVFSIMNDSGASVKGVICFGEDDIIGMQGKITKSQLDEMTAAGWTTGVYWEGEGDLDEYLGDMQAHFMNLGIPAFEAVMFYGGCYDMELDAVLSEYNVGFAIHSGEEQLPLLESGVDGILHVGYVSWGSKESQDIMDSLIKWGGIVSFAIEYLEYSNIPGAPAPIYSTSTFEKTNDDCVASFTRLLAYVEERVSRGILCADSLAGARLDRIAYLNEYDAILPLIEEAKAEILLDIAEIDRQISEIYRKYFPD